MPTTTRSRRLQSRSRWSTTTPVTGGIHSAIKQLVPTRPTTLLPVSIDIVPSDKHCDVTWPEAAKVVENLGKRSTPGVLHLGTPHGDCWAPRPTRRTSRSKATGTHILAKGYLITHDITGNHRRGNTEMPGWLRHSPWERPHATLTKKVKLKRYPRAWCQGLSAATASVFAEKVNCKFVNDRVVVKEVARTILRHYGAPIPP